MLNKSISLSAQVNKLNLKEKILFTWSIPHLDDYGLLDSDPEVIKAMVCPMIKDITIKDINQFVKKAGELGLLIEYQDCLEFTGFENHQSISAEKRAKMKFSKIPKIPQENSGENNNPQKSPVQDKIREDKIREDKLAVQSTADNPSKIINSLIKDFEGVNPSYEKLYANKTQRAALQRMIDKWGAKKVAGFVKYLGVMGEDKYAKNIITPLQLEDNLGVVVKHWKTSNPGVIKI